MPLADTDRTDCGKGSNPHKLFSVFSATVYTF